MHLHLRGVDVATAVATAVGPVKVMATPAVIPPVVIRPVLGLLGVMAALVGVLLISQGWRGRRVGATPACRRCNYDLSGRERGEGPVERCPECGTSLLVRRAVARGVRRRSGRRAVVGLVAVLLGSAVATVAIGPRIVATDWIAKLPTTVLHARVGERESFLGLLCPENGGPMPLIVPDAQMRFAASGGDGTFDLVLRPAGEMMRDRRGVGSFWNEEIVITGIPIRVPDDHVDDAVDDRGDELAE